MEKNYDFSGWATKNDILCSDGRTIKRNAFKDDDGKKVPLVWMHDHGNPENVLGHAFLVNKDEGVYCYGKFNDTPEGEHAKSLVKNGDISSLSIYANHLKHDSRKNVMHGSIKEVSLVLAGANEGAVIDNVVLEHSDGWEELEDEANIYFGDNLIDKVDVVLTHADEESGEKETEMDNEKLDNEKLVSDVIATMNDEQKQALYVLVGEALNDDDDDDDDEEDTDEEMSHGDDEGETLMKHNVFDDEYSYDDGEVLTHADMEEIFKEAKRQGSLKAAVEDYAMSHADSDYGIKDIDTLFPNARNLTNTPEFIKRETGWVAGFMNATKKTPFSRIKSTFANITEDEARAKGYIKGKQKKEEVFPVLKRTTSPTTVYKKQKLDRNDIIDITDFDVVAFIKQEMRIMYDEEIARAALLGDGRTPGTDDKIDENCIRPIIKDDKFYTVPVYVGATVTDYNELIKQIIRARKQYKGSGNPTFYTTEDVLTEMLLLEDKMGRTLYETVDKLCTKLRVSKIETVEVMEADAYKDYIGVIVNPVDYTFGADKGGEMNFFSDFDIDYNQEKYLYEGRCSGALTKYHAALSIIKKVAPVSGDSHEQSVTDQH